MAFPQYRILSAKRLSRLIKEANENGERFCFILGSGASVESGIPTGNTLEMQWMDWLMGTTDDSGLSALETRRTAADLHAAGMIEHSFEEIEAAWLEAKGSGGRLSSKYYFDIYNLRFYINPRNGYSYLEKIMERCDPSLGYHTLAKLLTENNLNNLVITTNFDSLVEDALFLYTDKRPLVIGHESLADYIEANIQRPIVAKVHRGLMYAPFNSPETTHELKKEWRSALSYAFGTYTPIVIGYAGGDRSLMGFLEEEATTLRNGVYWCYCGESDPAGLPDENIQKFVKEKHGCFVAIDGFDALMMEVGKTLYGDAIRPSRTAEHLEKRQDKRVRQYNEQWDELNKKPEIQKVLQPMNEAEQREEEQREKKEELTSWDYIRRSQRAKAEGRMEAAVEEATKAIEKDPQSAAAYNQRGVIYHDLKEFEKALEDYNRALQLEPDYAYAYNNRGVVYNSLGQYEKAVEEYSRAIELDSSYATAYNNRGIAYRNLRKAAKALEEHGKAIELSPNYMEAYNNRGVAYSDLGRYKKAVEEYSRAIELAPGYAMAYSNRGLAYRYLRQYKKAIEDYNKAIELDPMYAMAYSSRGSAYGELNEYEKAVEDYSRAIELDPADAGTYNNRGVAYKNLGQLKEAVEDYSRAIELSPQYALAYCNRGSSYDDLKEYEMAIKDYDRAIELDPANVGAYNNRGVVYKELGQWKRAIEDYSRAIELDPRYKRAYRNRAEAYRAVGEDALAEADKKAAEKL